METQPQHYKFVEGSFVPGTVKHFLDKITLILPKREGVLCILYSWIHCSWVNNPSHENEWTMWQALCRTHYMDCLGLRSQRPCVTVIPALQVWKGGSKGLNILQSREAEHQQRCSSRRACHRTDLQTQAPGPKLP